jgi:hypothetical protein
MQRRTGAQGGVRCTAVHRPHLDPTYLLYVIYAAGGQKYPDTPR